MNTAPRILDGKQISAEIRRVLKQESEDAARPRITGRREMNFCTKVPLAFIFIR
jgi:hypothetical protein